MANILKREIYVSIQFLLIVLVALVGSFLWIVSGVRGGSGEDIAVAINISEMWKNEVPYVKTVLQVFSALTVLRLAAIFLVHSFRKRVG